jgi:hypothetical protein
MVVTTGVGVAAGEGVAALLHAATTIAAAARAAAIRNREEITSVPPILLGVPGSPVVRPFDVLLGSVGAA